MKFAGCFHNVDYLDERFSNPEKKQWRNYSKNVFGEEDTITRYSLFHSSSYVFRNSIVSFPEWLFKVQSGDMALLALISNIGKLGLLEEVMSVYRRNSGGITANEDLVVYHKQRIELCKSINGYFNFAYNNKANEVIAFHKKSIREIRREEIKKRIKYLLKIIRK